jgi:hypothetical protein
MGLMCRLSGHKADPASGRWNGGVCFGRCGRCGRDLVRTVHDVWQVPRGYRVVWRAKPGNEPESVAPGAAERPGPAWPDRLEWEPEYDHFAAVAAWPAKQPTQPLDAWEPSSKGMADADLDAQVADAAGAPVQVEWPLSSPGGQVSDDAVREPAGQVTDDIVQEPPGNPPPAPVEEGRNQVHPNDADFMDDQADDAEWDDFPDHGRRTAVG